MPTLEEKRAAAAAKQSIQTKEADILCQKFAELFRTDLGGEILTLLYKRFDVEGRSFIPDGAGKTCPYRAATRDGERAAIAYIYQMARKADPHFKHPLTTNKPPCQTPAPPQKSAAQKTTSSSTAKK